MMAKPSNPSDVYVGNRGRFQHVLAFALTVAFSGGCSYLDLHQQFPWGAGDRGEPSPPTRVVSFWSDTVLTQANQPPLRGFGGRLLFYKSEDGKPIKIKGSLTVYAFDESSRDPNRVSPDRKYVFTAEQVAKHYSKSKLGHSYSFWLPWDEVGGEQKRVSLLVRFTSTTGGAVIGEQTEHLLPGLPTKEQLDFVNSVADANQPSPTKTSRQQGWNVQQMQLAPEMRALEPSPGEVEQVSFEAEVHEAIDTTRPRGRMMTTTIPMAMNVGNRSPTVIVNSSPARIAVDDSHLASSPADSPEAASSAQATAAGLQSMPSRSRPFGEPLKRLDRDRGPWRPSHVGWDYKPFSTQTAPDASSAGAANQSRAKGGR